MYQKFFLSFHHVATAIKIFEHSERSRGKRRFSRHLLLVCAGNFVHHTTTTFLDILDGFLLLDYYGYILQLGLNGPS